ncbi:AB hydrolase superfamily protein YfhM isoform X2 [Dermacentor silvarum]|nr:AB hydrolase superfamily protein YfhM isoform X2 [Dermacentor silvarum]
MLWSLLRTWFLATTAFYALRPAVSTALFLVFGACDLLWMCLSIAAAVCLKGRSVLEIRERTEEPACLRDPALGTHEFATLDDGMTLHYVSAGRRDKPLVLLLHGFPDIWYTWHKQILELKKNYWVVAPDMRGYGQSTKPSSVEEYQMSYLIEDVRGLLQSLGRNKVILVGHDWGAVVSWCFANRYPQMVDRLVTINGGHPDAMRQLLETSLTQIFKSRYMVAYQCPRIPEAWLTMDDFAKVTSLCNSGDDAQETSVLQYAFSKPGAVTAAVNYYRATFCKKWQLRKTRYRRLDIPTLVLWGSRDPYLTPQVAELSRCHSPEAVVRFLRECGHWPHLENAPAVNEALLAFLAAGAPADTGQKSWTQTLPVIAVTQTA